MLGTGDGLRGPNLGESAECTYQNLGSVTQSERTGRGAAQNREPPDDPSLEQLAVGMESPNVAAVEAANIADIADGLAVPRGGVRVPRTIHIPLATYIVKTLGLESLDEFIAMGAESAAATLTSLDEDYPAPFVTCLRSWIMAPATKEVRSTDNRSRMGRVALRSMEKAAVDSADSDGDESVMGGYEEQVTIGPRRALPSVSGRQ